jgi:hypothetical protein
MKGRYWQDYYYYVYSAKLSFQNFSEFRACIFSKFVSMCPSRAIMHKSEQWKGHPWKSLLHGNCKKHPMAEVSKGISLVVLNITLKE